MSGLIAWRPEHATPPDVTRSRDGIALAVQLPGVGEPRMLPAPVLDAEVQMWARPPVAAVFPLAPAGILRLYAHAQAVLAEAGVTSRLTDNGIDQMERLCWHFAHCVYAPGVPVRAAIDRAVEAGDLRPSGSDADHPALAQRAYLAAWAVVTGACRWGAEAVGA